MTFSQPIPVKTIAQKIGAFLATGINEIHKVQHGDITFVDVKKYFDKSLNSAASIIILNETVPCPAGKVLLLCDTPFDAYNSIIKEHRPFTPLSEKIGDPTIIHPSAIVEPGAIIGNHVRIGKYSYIQANAYIGDHTVIGDHVIVQSGPIIGTDAFYFKKKEDGFHKWRSGGRVILEDKVDIGAGSTVNKGVSGDTIIGEGTKLDCQVHIGHGVVIGKHCLLAAQVGIGGKTIVGDNVVMYGQVGIAQNLTIGAGAVILAKSGISKNLAGNKTYFGYPADDVKKKYKELAALRNLPDYMKDHR